MEGASCGGVGSGCALSLRQLRLEGRAGVGSCVIDEDVGLAAEGAVEDRDLFLEMIEVQLGLRMQDSC